MTGLVVASVLAAAAVGVTGDFTAYPGYRNRPAPSPVEAAIARGPITELIIRCPRGTAIISYSSVEGVFCTPRDGCFSKFGRAWERSCSR